ncbi:MAG: hypothetical protein IPK52_27350 [Chloroflexi bacterium]|nr:hypothetical protein [Chloroflexota bacterium]
MIDLPANADGQTKTNTAVVDYSTGSDTVTEDIDIVEPLIGLTKTFDETLVAVSNRSR